MMRQSATQTTVILYIISMIVAFTRNFGDLLIDNTLQLVIGALWIGFALVNVFAGHGKSEKRKELSFFTKLYLLPQVIIHLYTVILMICGVVSWEYMVTNVSVYIPTMLAIVSVYLFGQKALRYNVIAMIASYLLSVSVALVAHGPHIIIQAFRQAYLGVRVKNYFEIHDLVLAAGYIVIYYIATRSELKKRNISILILILLIMTIGMKRIAIVGLVVAIAFYIAIKRLTDRRQYKICRIIGIAGIFICYAYIYVLKSGIFDNFISAYSINTSGRVFIYNAAMGLVDFKISFPGIGRSVLGNVLRTDFSYLRVGGVHSDIIKMYVENGFIMFGLWLWYYLYHVTKLYKKNFGYKSSVIHFLITIFTFVLYATDNTENYYICLIISILAPMTYAINSKENDNKETMTFSQNPLRKPYNP